MADLNDFTNLAAAEQGLVVVSTTRADGTIQSSVVNAGILEHPDSGQPCVAFTTYGRAKLANLRARPWASVTARSGWRWATVEGSTDIAGPDDPLPAVEDLRLLLRSVFTAAGGTHDDWDEYDRVMAAERRAAVFVTPTRVYG